MKKLLSYLWPQKSGTLKTTFLPHVELNMHNGKLHIDGMNVNYSYGALHDVFRKVIYHKKAAFKLAKNVLILGFGAGSVAKILIQEQKLDHLNITGIEAELEMISLSKQCLPKAIFSKITLINEDAEVWINEQEAKFEIIIIDLFIEDKMPVFCGTKLFVENLAKSLLKNGMIIWNTLAHYDSQTLINKMIETNGICFIENMELFHENNVLIFSKDQD